MVRESSETESSKVQFRRAATDVLCHMACFHEHVAISAGSVFVQGPL